MHTPLITGSDCEGAGEMFQVTTLDPKNMPMTEDGKIDYSQDFFGKETNLTVSGQLNGETYAQRERTRNTAWKVFVLGLKCVMVLKYSRLCLFF